MTTPTPPATTHARAAATRHSARGLLPTASAALVYLATLFATPPDGPGVETATAAQIRAYLEANGSALRIQALALAVAGAAVVVLATGIASQLTARNDQNPRPTVGNLPGLVISGGVLIAGWHWLTAAAESGTAVQALDGTALSAVDDAVLRSWYASTNITHLYGDIAMLAIALLLTGSCLGSLRTGLLPRWVAVLGLVAAAAGTIGTVGVTLAVPALSYVWFGGLFGWTLWLPCTAISLLVRSRRQTA